MQTLQPKQYKLAEQFGLPLDPRLVITGYDGKHAAVPPIDPDYVYQREKLRDLLAFWTAGLKALKIKGDPATGKTSLVEQWHARLGWPLYMVPCSASTEASRLIGRMVPTETGTLKWVDGPVVKAAKEGMSVLLDEYNTLDPSQSTGLNMLLEGYSFVIEETGEVVKPHPNFRVFATENSVQSRLSVTGRSVQDVANDDRWMEMEADYLPAELETAALIKKMVASKIPTDRAELFAPKLVEVANQIRKAYRDEEDAIEKPMSTRSLIRWALLIFRFQSVPSEQGGPHIYALQRAFSMSPEMSLPVKTWAAAKFGTSL